MSRILIVGSHREDDAALALFRTTCEEVGFELARRDHQIVVCSNDSKCADPHVVAGANRAGHAEQPASVAYFVSSEELAGLDKPEGYSQDDYPNVSCQLHLTHRGWFSTYEEATQACDAVISLGGTPRGTGGALYIALSKGRPVLAIPATGGFSLELWDEFPAEYATLENEDEVALRGNEPTQVAKAAARSIERLIKKNPFPKTQRGLRYALLPLTMVAIGAAWVYLTSVSSSGSKWLPYVVAVVTASGGMLFRYATDDARRAEAYAGVARVSKDATRVLGAVLGIGILIAIGTAQAHAKTVTGQTLLSTWLALGGFAAGFLIEQVTEILTRALTSALGGTLKGSS